MLLCKSHPARFTVIAITLLSCAVVSPGQMVAAAPVQKSVVRAWFTTKIVDREPVDNIDTLTTEASKIYYFTELQGLSGKTIKHRWLFDDKTLAEVSFMIKGSRWRVNSSKNLIKDWLGEWTVEVVDEAGTVLHTDQFFFAEKPGGAAIDSQPPEPAPAHTSAPRTAEARARESAETTGRAESAPASSHIKRAAFATAIVDREPVNTVDTLYTDVTRIFFFTEVKDMAGQRIMHRWLHGSEGKAEVSFNIGGARWRVHSSKNLLPEWTGEWRVEVLGPDGSALIEKKFIYLKKP